MIATENITRKMDVIVEQARELLLFLQSKRNAEGISVASLKETASALKVTRATAKTRIERLADLGMIRRTGFGAYKLLHTEIEQSPIGAVNELARIISDMPNATYEEQAVALGMTSKELEAAYGVLVYLLYK